MREFCEYYLKKMNASAGESNAVMKEKDLLSDLQLRQCKASAPPSESSGNRCDASSIKEFQLAKLWSGFFKFQS